MTYKSGGKIHNQRSGKTSVSGQKARKKRKGGGNTKNMHMSSTMKVKNKADDKVGNMNAMKAAKDRNK